MNMHHKCVAVLGGLETGGMEISMLRLLQKLQGKGIDITLITPESEGPLLDRIPQQIEVRHCRFHSEFARSIGLNDFRSLGTARTLLYRLGRKMLTVLGNDRHNLVYNVALAAVDNLPKEHFDAVLDFRGYGSLTPAIGAVLQARHKATWLHDERMEWLNLETPYLHAYEKVFCVSESVRRRFCQLAPRYADKAEVLYNPVDAQSIQRKAASPLKDPRFVGETSGTPILVTLGRLEWQKGLDIAVEAAALMQRDGVDFRWYVLGEGKERKALEEAISRNGLERCFVLLGRVNNPYPYLAAADVYVQPSRYEGYSLSLQEARILGKPIVASDVPSSREQIDNGVNGVLAPLTPEMLASKITVLLADGEAQERFRKALRRESFDFDTQLDTLYRFLEE